MSEDQIGQGAVGGTESGDTAALTRRILIGLALGAFFGILLNWAALAGWLPIDHVVRSFVVDGVFFVGGQIFLASLKLLVVPLVLVSLACGTAALEDVTKLGRIGGKTLGLYLLTTAVAVSLAIFFAVLFEPGVGFDLPSESAGFAAREAPGFAQTLIDIFPDNPFRAMSEGRMLQVIVFAQSRQCRLHHGLRVRHIVNEGHQTASAGVSAEGSEFAVDV